MNRTLVSRLVYAVLLAGSGLVLGCGGGDRPLVKVSGKVTVDGKPLSSGQVTFIPEVGAGLDKESLQKAGKLGTGGASSGEIRSDGTYKIYTGGKEGAPTGKYKVTVMPSMVPAPEATEAPPLGFDSKFSDAQKTPLRKEVVAASKPGDYDLELTSGKK